MSDKSGPAAIITAVTGLVAACGALAIQFLVEAPEPMAEKSYEIMGEALEDGLKDAADDREVLANQLEKLHGYLEGREEIIKMMNDRINRLEDELSKRPSYGGFSKRTAPKTSSKLEEAPSLPKPPPKPPITSVQRKLPEWDKIQQVKK
jgi:hypothetical protein